MFEKLALPRVQRLKSLECLMELHHAIEILIGQPERLVQPDWRTTSAALRGAPGLSVIDQEVPHDLSREREEMRAIRQVDLWGIDQPEVRLVNESSRVDRIVAGRAPQSLVRELSEPVVDQGDELIPGVRVTGTPSLEEGGDLGRC
jgi:hypothetical protein